MVKELEFINNDQGDVTAVVIPIEEWLKIKDYYQQVKEEEKWRLNNRATRSSNTISDRDLESRSMRMLDDVVQDK
ncbi:hypothetical protein V6R21_24275 [Limibacter armeniacum]|uniref:hypothetical protein n=1 Tax=Limibacter armeniacum TaxID=466084 RepID=UPI002FE62EB7